MDAIWSVLMEGYGQVTQDKIIRLTLLNLEKEIQSFVRLIHSRKLFCLKIRGQNNNIKWNW